MADMLHIKAERLPSTLPCPGATQVSSLEAATPAFLAYSSRLVISGHVGSTTEVPVIFLTHYLDFLRVSFITLGSRSHITEQGTEVGGVR